MAVNVYIPTPFRRHTGGQSRVEIEAASVGELLQNLAHQFPDLAGRILDGQGGVQNYLNIFVNEEEIRSLGGLSTPLQTGDEISLIPAMAGGSGDTLVGARDVAARGIAGRHTAVEYADIVERLLRAERVVSW